jgi:hypothetical protein
MWKWIGRFVALFILATGVAGWVVWNRLHTYLHEGGLALDIAGQISETMMAPVTVGRVDLLEHHGAVINELCVEMPTPKPADQRPYDRLQIKIPPLLEVPKLTLQFEQIPALDQNITLTRLEIDHPRIWFDEAKGGGIAWPPYAPRWPAEKSPTLTAEAVAVRDGTLILVDRTGKPALNMDRLGVNGTFASQAGIVTGRGRLTASQVVLASKLMLSDFSADLVAARGGGVLENMKATFYGGSLQGQLSMAARPHAAPTEMDVTIQGADSNLVLKDVGLRSQIDLGPIEIQFRGRGDIFSPLLVSGEGTFSTGRVDASRIPVLARMEKWARDTRLAQAKFTSMQGNFRADNGVLLLDQIETLPKDSTRIMARGQVGLDGKVEIFGNIHAEGGVIGSVGNLLEKIGLKKEDQALVKIPFRITGTLDAPVVEMNKPKSQP